MMKTGAGFRCHMQWGLTVILIAGLLLTGCASSSQPEQILDLVLNEDRDRILLSGIAWGTAREDLAGALGVSESEIVDSAPWPGDSCENSGDGLDFVALKTPVSVQEPEVPVVQKFVFRDGELVGGELEIVIPAGEDDRFESVYQETAAQIQELLDTEDAFMGSELMERAWSLRDPDRTRCEVTVPWAAQHHTDDHVLLIYVGVDGVIG